MMSLSLAGETNAPRAVPDPDPGLLTAAARPAAVAGEGCYIASGAVSATLRVPPPPYRA